MAAIHPAETPTRPPSSGLRTALGAFVGFHLAQVLAGGAIGLVAGLSFGLQGGRDLELLNSVMLPMTGLFGGVFAGLWILHVCQRRDPDHTLRQRLGGDELRHLARSLGLGATIAATYVVGIAILPVPLPEAPDGPTALTSALAQACWIVLALAIAPFFEEILFRGVMLDALTGPLGFRGAAVATSALFVLAHVAELVRYWPAVVALTALAAVLAWTKKRSRGLGPCIAMHLGYNAVIVAGATLLG